MPHHELRFQSWGRASGRDGYELRLAWERDGVYLGVVVPIVAGGKVWGHRNEGGDPERFKQALASWTVSELRREVEAGRIEPSDRVSVYNVDTLAVERLAASDEELPELVEGAVVGAFDVSEPTDSA